MNALRKAILAATCVGSLVAMEAPALAQTTLRAVMHSDLKILDPIWTTAYIVRNHGYMIYDTLLAQDEKGEIKPQMVEKYEAAADGKVVQYPILRQQRGTCIQQFIEDLDIGDPRMLARQKNKLDRPFTQAFAELPDE